MIKALFDFFCFALTKKKTYLLEFHFLLFLEGCQNKKYKIAYIVDRELAFIAAIHFSRLFKA